MRASIKDMNSDLFCSRVIRLSRDTRVFLVAPTTPVRNKLLFVTAQILQVEVRSSAKINTDGNTSPVGHYSTHVRKRREGTATFRHAYAVRISVLERAEHLHEGNFVISEFLQLLTGGFEGTFNEYRVCHRTLVARFCRVLILRVALCVFETTLR